jgi:hypothetical protein
MRQFILLTLLWMPAGCASLAPMGQTKTSMKRHFEEDAMRAEILKYLSPGMPIENATRIMEDSGFKCKETFVASSWAVRCVAVHGTHRFWIADEIHVLLYHQAGKLNEIEVDCFSVGP